MLPPPRFIVFYNGEEKRPDYEQMKLSEAYYLQEERISLELLVDVLNVNKGCNEKLMSACKTLREYAEYIDRIRRYAKTMPIEEAAERATTECIREDILREFLEKNRAEAIAMSIYEYNYEEHMRMEREDSIPRLAMDAEFYREMAQKYLSESTE